MLTFSIAPSIINTGTFGKSWSNSVGVMVPGLAALKLTKQGLALSFPSASQQNFYFNQKTLF